MIDIKLLKNLRSRTSASYDISRRNLSDSNLRISQRDLSEEIRKYKQQSEHDENILQSFLAKRHCAERRNAICPKIDKLYYNKHLTSYMESLLREDYIKNFLL